MPPFFMAITLDYYGTSTKPADLIQVEATPVTDPRAIQPIVVFTSPDKAAVGAPAAAPAAAPATKP